MENYEAQIMENEVAQEGRAHTDTVKSTKRRGRPAGTFNETTIEKAQAAGLSPAEYVAQQKLVKSNGKRGRKSGSFNQATIDGAARLGITVEELQAMAKASKLTISEYLQLQVEKVA